MFMIALRDGSNIATCCIPTLMSDLMSDSVNRDTRPRVLSVPSMQRTNRYLCAWYDAAKVDPVLAVRHRIQEYKRTVFNPLWIWQHRREFDILHFHWQFQQVGVARCVLTTLVARKLGKQVFWTVHEVLPHDQRNLLKHFLIGVFLVRLADCVIVHNEYTEERLRRVFRSSRMIWRIEHPDYAIQPLRQTVAKSILGEKRFMYLFFGYIKAYKGLDLLIKAFDDRALDAVLYIVGQFPTVPGEEFTLGVNKNGIVLRAGECSEGDLDVYLSAADVVVLPYTVCYTSGALHRSLQHGKVLVVSRAVARTLQQANGRILVFEDADDLWKALLKARQAPTDSVPKTTLNVEQEQYQGVVSKLYR